MKGPLSDLLPKSSTSSPPETHLELSEPDWVPGVAKSIANGLLWDLLSKTRNLTCRNPHGAVGAGLPSRSIKINTKTVRSAKKLIPQTKMKKTQKKPILSKKDSTALKLSQHKNLPKWKKTSKFFHWKGRNYI